jgi:hypothetical protein
MTTSRKGKMFKADKNNEIFIRQESGVIAVIIRKDVKVGECFVRFLIFLLISKNQGAGVNLVINLSNCIQLLVLLTACLLHSFLSENYKLSNEFLITINKDQIRGSKYGFQAGVCSPYTSFLLSHVFISFFSVLPQT